MADELSLSLVDKARIDRLRDEFEQQWRSGGSPDLVSFSLGIEESLRSQLIRELLRAELQLRHEDGERFHVSEYERRLSGYSELLHDVFREFEDAPRDAGELVTMSINASVEETGTASPSEPIATHADEAATPERIGRYRVERVLGTGGFGQVLLARDEDLDRRVAIKIPRPNRIRDAGEIDAYVAEARTVAGLDAPGIVPVYDVGRTNDGCWYIVSKYIDGESLESRIRRGRPEFVNSVRLIATVARSLHEAHKRGFIHRDIKPANILLSAIGEPYLADFGLAVHEDIQHFRAGEVSGTPVYMSPEQVEGRAHYLDGRSDIWSLGVILFELLTGRRPFRAKGRKVLHEIQSRDPKPPRQIDDSIPPELETITLKCLRKLAADRYTTAKDLADDLETWLDREAVVSESARKVPAEHAGSSRSFWQSRQYPAALIAMAVVLLVALFGVVILNRGYDATSPDSVPRAQFSSTGEPPPAPGDDGSALEPEPSVADFDASQVGAMLSVTQFRYDANDNVLLRIGPIDGRPQSVPFGDEVRVDVHLPEAAYCYLLACNPDGVIQPCYPDGDGRMAPTKTTEITFPEHPTSYFGLTDGRGQQAFIVVVSNKPLPAWADWIAGQDIPWQATPQRGIWRYDGTRVTQTFAPTRGGIVKRTSDAFANVCEALQSLPNVQSVRGIAFAVD